MDAECFDANAQRGLTRQVLLTSVESLEIIEPYEDDKYLPSFLLRGENGGVVFHAQIAVDVEAEGNVRVATMYVPSPHDWHSDGRARRSRQ